MVYKPQVIRAKRGQHITEQAVYSLLEHHYFYFYFLTESPGNPDSLRASGVPAKRGTTCHRTSSLLFAGISLFLLLFFFVNSPAIPTAYEPQVDPSQEGDNMSLNNELFYTWCPQHILADYENDIDPSQEATT